MVLGARYVCLCHGLRGLGWTVKTVAGPTRFPREPGGLSRLVALVYGVPFSLGHRGLCPLGRDVTRREPRRSGDIKAESAVDVWGAGTVRLDIPGSSRLAKPAAATEGTQTETGVVCGSRQAWTRGGQLSHIKTRLVGMLCGIFLATHRYGPATFRARRQPATPHPLRFGFPRSRRQALPTSAGRGCQGVHSGSQNHQPQTPP